jgi:hypothetical protein
MSSGNVEYEFEDHKIANEIGDFNFTIELSWCEVGDYENPKTEETVSLVSAARWVDGVVDPVELSAEEREALFARNKVWFEDLARDESCARAERADEARWER